ncbi:hypothetical protein [macacine gammaherpesvirus 13]|uniref:Immunoglobulin domain-containing protein n=1 Tax=macacine gammaherpesvirus 13 TaxID=2341050 RepID=A0A3G1T4I1_9GAMA|nr:hypothetical protein QKT43_gp74 [Macaca arctoides gammaherpesvirus 1]AYA49859.1 hypothetical protein [Macaca arctoides gammaherpesvirus 1]
MTHLVLLLCCCVGSVCAFFSNLVKFENATAPTGADVNITCSVPKNESVSHIELGKGFNPGDGIPTLGVATSNNGTHVYQNHHNYTLTLEWSDSTNTSVTLTFFNLTSEHEGDYICNVTLVNCSLASGVHCNYTAEDDDEEYHANRTLTARMHLTVIPATTITPTTTAPTTTVVPTTSTSHQTPRRPSTKRPTRHPVTLGPFPVDPWHPRPTWVHWALLLITCAVVAPVLLVIIIACCGWLMGWGRRRKGWIPV